MLLLLTLLSLLSYTEARVARGVLTNVREQFSILANFCFDWTPQPSDPNVARIATGSVSLSLSPPRAGMDVPSGLTVVAYNDLEDQWPAIYDENAGRFIAGMSCADRAAVSRASHPALSNTRITSWDTPIRITSINQGIRPRFWFWGLACCDCAADAMEGIEFDIALRNDVTGWPERQWEFGYDEKGMQDVFLTYFFAYLVLLGLNYLALKKFTALNGSVHRLVMAFSAVLVLEFFSIIFNMGHWFGYQRNGMGSLGAQGFATFLNILSRIIFAGILILLAQGYQITTKFIPLNERPKLFLTFGLLTLMYIIQIFWEFLGREPEHVRQPLGERWLVAILSLCWFAFGGYFGRLCYITINSDLTTGEKKIFAKKLGVFTIWMICLPIFNFVYMGIAPTHYVRGTVTTNLTITTLAYMYFTFLTWPNAKNAATLSAPEGQVYAQLPGGGAGDGLLGAGQI